MAVPAIAADKHRDLSGPAHRHRDHRGGNAPNLHVIKAKIVLAHALCEVVEQREGRDALPSQPLDRSIDAVMIDSGAGEGVDLFTQHQHRRREILGVLRRREGHRRPPANVTPGSDRRFNLAGEILVKFLLLLVQDKAEMHLGNLGREPVVDQATGMVADPVRCIGHLARRLLAHLGPAVQYPVDRRHPDTGFTGKILDRRSSGHRVTPDRIPSSLRGQDDGI